MTAPPKKAATPSPRPVDRKLKATTFRQKAAYQTNRLTAFCKKAAAQRWRGAAFWKRGAACPINPVPRREKALSQGCISLKSRSLLLGRWRGGRGIRPVADVAAQAGQLFAEFGRLADRADHGVQLGRGAGVGGIQRRGGHVCLELKPKPWDRSAAVSAAHDIRTFVGRAASLTDAEVTSANVVRALLA